MATKPKYLVFSVGIGGYDVAFRNNVMSHEAYAKRHGYSYRCITGPHNPEISREIAWLKVPALLGALKAGYEAAMFLDTDTRINDHCPPFHELFGNTSDVLLAPGHSGRVNSGVILVRNTEDSQRLLQLILSSVGRALPKWSSVGWGENGYFIFHLKRYRNFKLLSHQWNNTYDREVDDYIRHFTGPMRDDYVFNPEEARMWSEITARKKAPGESGVTDPFRFLGTLASVYRETVQALPEFAPWDASYWFPTRPSRPPARPMAVHMCVGYNKDDPSNPYVSELLEALLRRSDDLRASYGVDDFWNKDFAATDCLHIQWAEDLCGWKKPSDETLERISDRLREVAATTRILLTVHNLSLMAAFEEQADKLMDIMGEHVHAFIHLTKSSVHSFKTRYEGRAWVAAKPHYIAEHGHYEMYRRSSSPQEQLVPGHVSPYVLVFGGIRTRDEIEFCEEMALHLKEDGVTLVMAGPVSDHVMHWKVRKQLNRTCEGNIYRLHERVPTSAVYPMVANASAVLIPRSDRLNSGVQFLAITFGVPVVAPAMHSLGEVQRESGNPVYKEGDRKDAYETLRGLLSATALQRMGRRQQAFRYKHERMSWAMIARQHIAAYRAVLGSVG